jgi:hypothetical protein
MRGTPSALRKLCFACSRSTLGVYRPGERVTVTDDIIRKPVPGPGNLTRLNLNANQDHDG